MAVDQTSKAQLKVVVAYHYFEKDAEYAKNFANFLLFGISGDCDYIIVISGPYAAELPRKSNVRYLFTENKNNDYGGFSAAIETLGDAVQNYTHVLFVNSSVRGPFTPPFSTRRWQDIFIDALRGEVGLVGSTINILSGNSEYARRYQHKYGGEAPVSHVQTTAYAMPIEVLQRLRECGFYQDRPSLDKIDVITDYELRLSRLVLENGWNITALLPEYQSIDYRREHADINPTSVDGDAHCALAYFGRTPHPFELIFVKTNRGLFDDAYLDRLAYSALCRGKPNVDWENGALIDRYVSFLEAVGSSPAHLHPPQERYTVQKILQLNNMMLELHPESAGPLAQILARKASR